MTIINIILLITIWNLLMSIINKNKTNLLYCGIVGFSGKTSFDMEKIKLLMVWNSHKRGSDSTGIYSPKNGLKKDIKEASDFLIETPIEEDTLLIAHVRAKTVGANIVKNAHPFMEENVVLCHNGTLKNHYGLLRKHDLSFQKHDVDSHIMCSIMAKDKDFKVLSEIDGAAAVLIHDTNNPSILYAYRNSERPLYKGSIDGNMYISSIEKSLEFIGCKNIKEFKENYLYTIVDGLIQGSPRKIVNKPYVPPNTTVVSNTFISNEKLVNYLIKYTSTYNGHYAHLNDDMTWGKEYLVLDWSTSDFKVKDDSNKEVSISSYKFDKTGAYFTTGDYVMARQNLWSQGVDAKIVIAKDDVCVLDKDKKGSFRVLNLRTNTYHTVDCYYLRNLTALELDKFLTPDTSNEDNSNLDLQFNESFNLFNHAGVEYYNKDTHEEEEEQDDVEDNSDEYLDLTINEEKLLNDFENINIAIADLNDFTKDYIPTKDEVNYKTKVMELNAVLVDCIDYYTVTNKVKK